MTTVRDLAVDAFTYGLPPGEVGRDAAVCETAGLDGWFVAEGRHDPFLQVGLAASRTTRLTVGTCVAIALVRGPVTVAHLAHDLDALSGGRFVLGLGTQVRAHVVRRHGAKWERPVEQMGEFIEALRAIWRTWRDGVPLRYEGRHYRHTLMPPQFVPEPPMIRDPVIELAAVGPRMLRLAATHADGLVIHVLNSRRWLEEVVRPQVRDGLAAADRHDGDLDLVAMVAVIHGRDGAERDEARRAARRQVAFYVSTPAYRSVLEVHGWEGLHHRLHALSRDGAWEAMADEVDDEVLGTFVVDEPDPQAAGREIAARFSGLVDRVRVAPTVPMDAEAWTALAAGVRGRSGPR